MKIAVMQPYFFPYIGYFQLINAVDKFVIYDDVNFIKKGWINRNYLLLNGKRHLITIPLKKQSQNKLISETELNITEKWKNKTLKTIGQSYKKAPFFNQIFKLIEEIFDNNTLYISNFNKFALNLILDFLDIEAEIIISSNKYNNSELKAQERIIDICKQEKAKHYINPIGGINIYDTNKFKEEGIKINFLQTNDIKYTQFNNEFVNRLSIIDTLMFNGRSTMNKYLQEYKLI